MDDRRILMEEPEGSGSLLKCRDIAEAASRIYRLGKKLRDVRASLPRYWTDDKGRIPVIQADLRKHDTREALTEAIRKMDKTVRQWTPTASGYALSDFPISSLAFYDGNAAVQLVDALRSVERASDSMALAGKNLLEAEENAKAEAAFVLMSRINAITEEIRAEVRRIPPLFTEKRESPLELVSA